MTDRRTKTAPASTADALVVELLNVVTDLGVAITFSAPLKINSTQLVAMKLPMHR